MLFSFICIEKLVCHLHCRGHGEIRSNIIKLQQPYNENNTEIIGNLLFKLGNKEEMDETKEFIYKMWKKREKLEKEITN